MNRWLTKAALASVVLGGLAGRLWAEEAQNSAIEKVKSAPNSEWMATAFSVVLVAGVVVASLMKTRRTHQD